MPATADDQEVVFRRLFDAHARSILGYALRRTEGSADAADVVAETFLVAWRRITEVPTGGETRPWLFGVARRVLANQRRGNVRRNALADRLREQVEQHVVDQGAADDSESVQSLRDALERLKPDDREVLLLTAWEGLAPAEIAVALDIPAATVRTRLHRARQRLRRVLADPVTGPAEQFDRERGVAVGHADGDGTSVVRDVESTS